ncbi:MAG: hypothetical protein MUE40_08685 [Anaerolineae bacterium]|nr:hypothetical protein [Anaerolineae bacterium]
MKRSLWIIVALCSLLSQPALAQNSLRQEFLTQYSRVAGIVFSPDSTLLATTSFDLTTDNTFLSSVQVWDIASGQVRGAISSAEGQPVSAAFNADSTLLYTGLEFGRLAVWNAADFQLTNIAAAHDRAPEIALSRDGRYLLSADSSGVIIWDAPAFNPLLILTPDPADPALLLRALLSPDSTYFAGLYTTGEVRLHSLTDGSRLNLFNPGYGVEPYTAAFSPDGLTLALGYETLELWSPQAGLKTGELATGSAIFAAAFSPDGTAVATVDAAGRLLLWDVATRQPRQTLAEGINEVWAVAFSPDGTLLALARDAGLIEFYALP